MTCPALGAQRAHLRQRRVCTTVRPVLVRATIMTRTRPSGRRTSWIGARSPQPRTVRTLRPSPWIRALTNRPRRGCRSRIRSGRRQRRGSVTRGRCSPAVPDQRLPETRWPTIPWPSLERRSSTVQPSTRLAYGVPPATTTSRKSNSSPQRTVGLQRARRCQRCSRSQGTTSSGPLRRPLAAASRDLRKRPPHEARCLPLVVRSGRDSRSCLAPQPVANLGSGNAAKLLRLSALPRQGRRGRRRQSRTRGRCAWPGGRRCRGT